MKRTSIVLCAVLVAAAATPAAAEIVYTPQPPDSYLTDFIGGIGLYNYYDPYSLNTVMVTSGSGAVTSDNFVFTFAAHLSTYYTPALLNFSFAYDNDSIEVIGARPVGDYWDWNNYSTGFTWPNPSSGWTVVPSLIQTQIVTGTGTGRPTTPFTWYTSCIVPFFQVTLHVKGAQTSHYNGFGIVALSLYDTCFGTVTTGQFKYFGGGIHEVPEPASMTLLFAGLAGITGRVVRRRRHMR